MKPRAVCSNRTILLPLIQFLLAICPSSLTNANEIHLSQSELKAKYGQGTQINSTRIVCILVAKVVKLKAQKCYFQPEQVLTMEQVVIACVPKAKRKHAIINSMFNHTTQCLGKHSRC